MKKKVLTTGLMATFVAAALSGCQQEEQIDSYSFSGQTATPVISDEKTESYTVGSASQCAELGAGDAATCAEAWNTAQAEHIKQAPKFQDSGSCEAQAGVSCEAQRVQHSDGSWTDVFIPAMAGMIVGNMLGNMMHKPQPIYYDRDRRYVTGGGVPVVPGKSMASVSAFKSSPHFAPAGNVFSKGTTVSKPSFSKTSSGTSKVGGFGSSAKGSSAS